MIQLDLSENAIKQFGLKFKGLKNPKEVLRFGRPETIKAVKALEKDGAAHNAEAETFCKTLNMIADGNIEGDGVKLIAEIPRTRVRLAQELVRLIERKNALPPIINADFKAWHRNAQQDYDKKLEEKKMQAVALFPHEINLQDAATAKLVDRDRHDVAYQPQCLNLATSLGEKPEIELMLAKYALGYAILELTGTTGMVEMPASRTVEVK